MRILHCSDVHQDLATHGSTDPATGLNTALLSTASCWAAAVDAAIAEEVDVVIIAGDTFHGRNPSASSLNLFDRELRRLADAQVPTLIIPGNHDAASRPEDSIVNLFASPMVTVSTRPEIVRLGGLGIGTIPWVSREQLMAGSPGLSREGADLAMADGLRRVIDAHAASKADLIVGHWTVQGVLNGAERDLSAMVGEPVIGLVDLEGPWSYAAMGHIHKSQELQAGATTVRYAGSIDRISFSEEAESKTATIVDLDGPEWWPVELPARRFVTIAETPDGDYTGTETDSAGAIVRVRGSAGFVKDMAREVSEQGAAKVLEQVAVERVERSRSATVTDVIAPMEAFEEWMNLREIHEEERPFLRDQAKALLEGSC